MAAVLVVGLVRGATTASATLVPEKTDIMFIFDTSGSMGNVLTEAKEGIKKSHRRNARLTGPRHGLWRRGR